jgi:hypothetical protein
VGALTSRASRARHGPSSRPRSSTHTPSILGIGPVATKRGSSAPCSESSSDWEYLREQILARVADSPVTAIRPSPPWGTEYEVRVAVDGLNGVTHAVITGWLLPSEGPPRLITAYVELPRRA